MEEGIANEVLLYQEYKLYVNLLHTVAMYIIILLLKKIPKPVINHDTK